MKALEIIDEMKKELMFLRMKSENLEWKLEMLRMELQRGKDAGDVSVSQNEVRS